MIFINQVRDNVGVMFGETEITPGGRALKHMASVRARVKRTSKLESGSQYGSVVNIKNKVSKPREKADFKIDQKKGFIKKPETKRK